MNDKSNAERQFVFVLKIERGFWAGKVRSKIVIDGYELWMPYRDRRDVLHDLNFLLEKGCIVLSNRKHIYGMVKPYVSGREIQELKYDLINMAINIVNVRNPEPTTYTNELMSLHEAVGLLAFDVWESLMGVVDFVSNLLGLTPEGGCDGGKDNN